jgi:TolA-binding protein
MGRDRRSLSEFGQLIAGTQDTSLRQVDAKAQKARLVRAVLAPPWRSGKAWLAGVAAVASAAAVATIVLRPHPIHFQVGEAKPGTVSEWIQGGQTLVFSEGTRIDLAREARARIASVDGHGATVVLESGRATASVFHRDGARWTILAGPFQVRVTGTRLETAWDPASETFELALREGSVTATGPLLGEGRALKEGETLRVFVRAQRLELARGESAADAPAAPAVPTSIASDEPSPPTSAPAATASAPQRTSWQELASHGKYKEAMAIVEREGFDGVLAKSSAKDLVTLGDVARLSGESAKAVATLNAIRSRFAGSSESAASAFLLGRLAFEQKGALAEAERWFTTYLSEQPAGPFAREAAGRVLECRVRRGDGEGAREAAKRYLDRYPDGPHAAKARSILDE